MINQNMRVLRVVFVAVCVGQVCQGALLPQGASAVLRRTFRSPALPVASDYVTHRELKDKDSVALRKYLRTVIRGKEMKYKLSGTQTGPDRPEEHRGSVSEPVPAFLTATKPPALPPRPLTPSLRDTQRKAGDMRLPLHQLKPGTPHTRPVELPDMLPCKKPRRHIPNIATAPPNVCDLCPEEDGKNPLAPCTCVGVGGTSAGQISINCPSSIISLDQLRDIFSNTNFLVTHVFQFTLQGSNADGALRREIWGDLEFKYVKVNGNKITEVDNGAFINSSDTLIDLNLANNEIRNYIAMYNDLPNLMSLNLHGNKISIIYSEDFRYPLLTKLDLSSNLISSIGKRSFAGLQKLTSLNLSDNQLTSIGDQRFSFTDHDFSNALVIDLSHNKISSMSDTAFKGLRYVEIDFRFNQLKTLDKDIFYPIITDSQYFVYFHFSDNPMVCDCDMLWVLQDGGALLCFDNFLCTNNNIHLYSLSVSDLGNCTLSTEGSHQ